METTKPKRKLLNPGYTSGLLVKAVAVIATIVNIAFIARSYFLPVDFLTLNGFVKVLIGAPGELLSFSVMSFFFLTLLSLIPTLLIFALYRGRDRSDIFWLVHFNLSLIILFGNYLVYTMPAEY